MSDTNKDDYSRVARELTIQRLDQSRRLTNENSAVEFADYLRNIIEARSLPPVSGPFLGLGASEGIGEQAFAADFGLENQITLVDKNVDRSNRQFIESDIFEFLQNWRGNKFGLVSVFGLEYIIEKEETWNALWKGLERVCKKGAYVFVVPFIKKIPFPQGTTFSDIDVDNESPPGIIAFKK